MRVASLARHGCVLALLCLTAGAAWSAGSADNAILRYEVRITDGKKPARKIVRKIWKKGDKYRVEVITPKGTQITVGGPKGAYNVIPGTSEAVHVPRPAATKAGLWVGLFGDTTAMRRAKKVGRETLIGRTTEIFEQRMGANTPGVAAGVKGSTRVWLAAGLPMPFKAVTKIERGPQTTLTLKSIQLGARLPDSLFELPREVSVRPPVMLPGMIPAEKVPKRAWFRKR
jgi:outer membrane lipoprotein-sorting protein